MQHEEVMFSKKSTYDNYMGKVKDEIADPEVSRFSTGFHWVPPSVSGWLALGLNGLGLTGLG